MTNRGVQDLMDKQRFKPKHIQKALLENNVPGNWDSLQNIYNLVKANNTPKDPYVYIVLANLLNVDVHLIITRYSKVAKSNSSKSNVMSEDSFDDSSFNW